MAEMFGFVDAAGRWVPLVGGPTPPPPIDSPRANAAADAVFEAFGAAVDAVTAATRAASLGGRADGGAPTPAFPRGIDVGRADGGAPTPAVDEAWADGGEPTPAFNAGGADGGVPTPAYGGVATTEGAPENIIE